MAGRVVRRDAAAGDIAAAVCGSPGLLIADEPTTALDTVTQKGILDLLDGLKERSGMAVLLITHDVDIARDRGDAVAVMDGGWIVESGTVEACFRRPRHQRTRAMLDARLGGSRGIGGKDHG